MGVLTLDGDDVGTCLVPFLSAFGPVDPKDVWSAYKDARIGRLSSLEFWSMFGERDHNLAYVTEAIRIRTPAVNMIKRVRKDYAIALLSNDVSEWSSILRKSHNPERC